MAVRAVRNRARAKLGKERTEFGGFNVGGIDPSATLYSQVRYGF